MLIPIDICPIKKFSFLGVREIIDGPDIAPKNPQIPTIYVAYDGEMKKSFKSLTI